MAVPDNLRATNPTQAKISLYIHFQILRATLFLSAVVLRTLDGARDWYALDDGNKALCAEDSIENGGMRSEQNKTLSSRAGAKKKLRAIRQHVNPLSSLYQRPANISAKWVEDAFANPSLPFHIDIGSARGRFCIYMAREHPDMNFLGLEIRRPCVEESFKKMEKYRVKDNVHFLALNVNVDLERIVADVRKHSEIVRYSVQFPDPHFKAKHKKRRVIQPALVACMCKSLKSDGGEIFIQSDVEEVAVSMRDAFRESTLVADASASGAWMEENPLNVPTEREVLTLSRGDPVYRTVFCRGNH
ncbi:hypothetical protein NSK_004343 [Nannochloropsis salina CCMP1776]|uniref:tRNA (guanine(46)-N(7))-methyltransferase n=1 Tax=Nannochloropsis salina CCMP1776 TaxID=1027361 RepID=A0A4D9D4K7_9STRA|nr:hypothetical protein NSK_004343 [Nannochloropsis salina CCMP1776]|eukprot:TFJ84355.1 hypothetical protein NSK_004343 [Nannochloropsis salina CCMP1776]